MGQSSFVDNIVLRLFALAERLRRKRLKSEDDTYFAQHVVRCSGCQQKPLLTRFDDANSYHITCVTPSCKDPHWLDCTIKNRSLKQALDEWYTLNTGQSLN